MAMSTAEEYRKRSSSFDQKPTVSYTVLWDLGNYLCVPCLAIGLPKNGWTSPSKRSKAPVLEEARKELQALRIEASRQLWSTWDADDSGLPIEVMMLSGRSWRFVLGSEARGVDVKERIAALSGMLVAEMGLLCAGGPVEDEECVLSPSRRAELEGQTKPQLRVIRVARHRALSCSTDCTLKLWDLHRGQCIQTLRGHGDGVLCLAVDWEGQVALSGAHDATLRLWDLDHGICAQSLDVPGHPPFCAALDYPVRRAITGSWDCTLRFWDLDAGRCLQVLEGHDGLVACVALEPGGARRALSGSYDGSLRLWDLVGDRPSIEFVGHEDKVVAVDVDWGASRALSGGYDASVRLWDLDAGCCLKMLRGHSDVVSCVSLQWDADRPRALSGSYDRELRLWDLKSCACLGVLGHDAGITSLSVDWDAARVLTGSSKEMRLWDLDQMTCEHSLEGHTLQGPNVSLGLSQAVSCVQMNRLARASLD
eukprot:TRINITY_DN14937_c0_g6_i1.p1 TRINITY_DN14937_c0_g6~~TRINITY_DN14937_c0_g6_i1.p1  ORF type:complete len:515 (-),score=100.06 TRINITY_DN14937_c0_g6_i1:197-1636(-)